MFGIQKWFQNEAVVGAKVLVCSLGTDFGDAVELDGRVYERFYTFTSSRVLSSITELNEIIERHYDVVHLFCRVRPDGTIEDYRGDRITGTDLIKSCRRANVKLLWIANDNNPDGYLNGFRGPTKQLNLAMTISRKGSQFPDFLSSLLSCMSQGSTMPVAWSNLAPQIAGPEQTSLPECIFVAGRPGVVLR